MVTRQEFLSGLLEPLPAAMAPLAIADIPGAFVRGKLSGQPFGEAFRGAVADPLSFEGRTYGEDITGDPYSGMLVELLTDPMVLMGAGMGGLGMALARYSRGAAAGMGEDVLKKLARGTSAERLLAAQVAADETVARGLVNEAGEFVESAEVSDLYPRLVDALNDMAVKDPGKQWTKQDLYRAFTPESSRQPGLGGSEEKQMHAGIFRPPRAGIDWEDAVKEGNAQFVKSDFLKELLGETAGEPTGPATWEMKEHMLPFLKVFTANLSEGESVPITSILQEYSSRTPRIERQLYRGEPGVSIFEEISEKAPNWYDEQMDLQLGVSWADIADPEEGATIVQELADALTLKMKYWSAEDWGRQLRRMAEIDGVDPVSLWDKLRNRGWVQDEIGLFAGIVPPRGTPLEAARTLEPVLFSVEVANSLSAAELDLSDIININPRTVNEWEFTQIAADKMARALGVEGGGGTFIGNVMGVEKNDMTLWDWVLRLNQHVSRPEGGIHTTRPGKLTFMGAGVDDYGDPLGRELSAMEFPTAAPPNEAVWDGFLNERDRSIPVTEGGDVTEGGLGPVKYGQYFPREAGEHPSLPETYGLGEEIELRPLGEVGEAAKEQWHTQFTPGTPAGRSMVQHTRYGISHIPGEGMEVGGEHVSSKVFNVGETQGGEGLRARESEAVNVLRTGRVAESVDNFSGRLSEKMVPNKEGYPIVEALREVFRDYPGPPGSATGLGQSEPDLARLRNAIADYDPEILTDPHKAAKYYVAFLANYRYVDAPSAPGPRSRFTFGQLQSSLGILTAGDTSLTGPLEEVVDFAYYRLSPQAITETSPKIYAPGASSLREAKDMFRSELRRSGFHAGPDEDILIERAVTTREYILPSHQAAPTKIETPRALLNAFWQVQKNPELEGMIFPTGDTINALTNLDNSARQIRNEAGDLVLDKTGKPRYAPGPGSQLYGENREFSFLDYEADETINPFPKGYRGDIQKYIEKMTGEKVISMGDLPGVDTHDYFYVRLRDKQGNWISSKVAKLMNFLREKGVPLIPGISPFLVLEAMERQRRY